MIKIVEVTEELPESATHGFRLFDDEDVIMFFHWNENAEEHTHTRYEDVLKAFPDRMAAMGYESDIDPVLGEIVGMFGSG